MDNGLLSERCAPSSESIVLLHLLKPTPVGSGRGWAKINPPPIFTFLKIGYRDLATNIRDSIPLKGTIL